MFRWLVSQFSSVEAETESLDSPSSIRALVAELNAAPADRVIRTLSERFEQVPRQGLTAPQCSRALTQLDEFAQPRLIELWESLLTEARGQSVSDAVWHLLTSYYRKVHGGYWFCLGNYSDSNPLTAKDHADAMILASRAMTALGKYMLLLRMRYRSAPKDVWAHVNKLVAWVERRGNSTVPVEQYSGTGIKTTIERELLAILLVEVAPSANLLPAQLHALDRFVRPYAGHYSISDTYDEQARPFAYEPSRNEPPRRWLKGLQVRPGVRFFGIGGAYSELCNACEDGKVARSIPQWIGRTRCTIDDYRDLLQRLVAEWSKQPPSRSQLRELSPGEILVAHEWADIRRLVTFGELARSGQSLMYDSSNIYGITNTVLPGRSEAFRDSTAEEVMLANLRSFEQSLRYDATNRWGLTDFSDGGIGATAAENCAWVKVGMLVAFRGSDTVDWQIAMVRRLNAITNARLSIGMTTLPGTVSAARLRLGVGTQDYSRSIGRSETAIEYDALVLQDAVCTLLLPIGVFDTTSKYTLHWNNRQDVVKMERSVERGLNFERVEISIVEPVRVT